MQKNLSQKITGAALLLMLVTGQTSAAHASPTADLPFKQPPFQDTITVDDEAQARRGAYLPVLLKPGVKAICPEGTHDHGDGSCHTHPSGHNGLDWPPTPRNITQVRVVSQATDYDRIRARLDRGFSRMIGSFLTDARVLRALGRRFTRIEVIESDSKDPDYDSSRIQLVYFSRDNNTTVDIYLNGSEVERVVSTPAAQYQPEITNEEIDEAGNLARKHFVGLGHSRVQSLQRYGILAYQPSGSGFYDTRVIYVTFHKEENSFPEFVAWVDLSNQRILDAREER
ncbi:MAG: hypothetical protein KIH69_001620 [Anaerolineae bacterium]|nr:hypothetical protein [Anaerolineae bacterium]